jgi:hypothetical protein
MVTVRTTTTKTSRDRDHDDRNTSDQDCISCCSYHLRDVVVTMAKYVVVKMIPMIGDHKDNSHKDKLQP